MHSRQHKAKNAAVSTKTNATSTFTSLTAKLITKYESPNSIVQEMLGEADGSALAVVTNPATTAPNIVRRNGN